MLLGENRKIKSPLPEYIEMKILAVIFLLPADPEEKNVPATDQGAAARSVRQNNYFRMKTLAIFELDSEG